MKRRIFALLEVDDDTAFQKIDDGPISYLAKEMDWLEPSNIFCKMPLLTTMTKAMQNKHILTILQSGYFMA